MDIQRQLTAIVTAFQSPKSTSRLIGSLERRLPGMRVLVASESDRLPFSDAVTGICMPMETGVAASRNALLARVRTPYFLLLDGRYRLTRKTSVERLLGILEGGEFDLVAGEVLQCRRGLLRTRRQFAPLHGTFQVEPAPGGPSRRSDQLQLRRGGMTAGQDLLQCHVAHDFFVARTDRIRSIGGWDQTLDEGGRLEFFYRAWRHDLQVGLCSEVQIERQITAADDHSVPSTHSMGRTVARMGFARMIDFDGREWTAEKEAKPQAA